jgi:hypothetical protein
MIVRRVPERIARALGDALIVLLNIRSLLVVALSLLLVMRRVRHGAALPKHQVGSLQSGNARIIQWKLHA